MKISHSLFLNVMHSSQNEEKYSFWLKDPYKQSDINKCPIHVKQTILKVKLPNSLYIFEESYPHVLSAIGCFELILDGNLLCYKKLLLCISIC